MRTARTVQCSYEAICMDSYVAFVWVMWKAEISHYHHHHHHHHHYVYFYMEI